MKRKNYKLRRSVVLGIIFTLGISIFLLVNTPKAPLEIAQNLDSFKKILPFNPNADIEPQTPLANPPKVIKAIYATNWSAGSAKSMARLIKLANETEINSIVIDIKDYTGIVGYETKVPLVKEYGAEESRIPKINTLIKQLHDANIYVIGRIVVFEDEKLAEVRPDLALQSKKNGGVWVTTKGQHWLDASSKEVWDYNISIAKDALSRGFDEINFDYIRFASDGNLADIKYPFYGGKITKRKVIADFFRYLRAALGEARISADLFGMAATNNDDLGIGQYLEDALPYFDAIGPMVYPSHYITGFLGFKNPAKAPYEVVRYSMDKAVKRIRKYESDRAAKLAMTAVSLPQTESKITNLGPVTATALSALQNNNPTPSIIVPPPVRAKLRPWLQDFNLGAIYGSDQVRAQIKATSDALVGCTQTATQPAPDNQDVKLCDSTIHNEVLGDIIEGWMLWNPSNIYTRAALTMEGQ